MSGVDVVEALVEPGLYEARSHASGTRYFVDTRLGVRLRYLRLPGDLAPKMRLDLAWCPLSKLECLPRCWNGERFLNADEIDMTDLRRWTLCVGSEHVLYTPDSDPGRPPIYWVKSSPCAQIRRLDALPADIVDALETPKREATP